MDKKISTIIPIYNAEKYLRETLDCVCNQSYKNLEIVCVLDCPTDTSENIVNEYALSDERIIVIKQSANSGPGATRNLGVEKASGEYIHFMDSDDIVTLDFYRNMLIAATDMKADVVACSVFYEKKPKESVWFWKNKTIVGNAKFNKTEVVRCGWAVRYLIKKDFWNKNKLTFPDFTIMEDCVAMVQMVHYAEKIALCSNALYIYKDRETSILNKIVTAEEQIRLNSIMGEAQAMVHNFLHTNKIKQPAKWQRKLAKFLRKFKRVKYP
ncbi:MAG: glycosyltransferase [Bacteroidales bacterium]|jgi:glycosyltransferase involved in cell wall biosynthesis|nr:glycosyltransferase [Bacteroidales bacterium]